MTTAAAPRIHATLARALAPRRPLTVSQWADANRILSTKASSAPGRWRTSRNPPLREPMDCLSARSTVHQVVLKFPIQFGKTSVAENVIGYTMDHDPCPIMVTLPGEVSMNKWVAQKLTPMIDETPCVKRAMASVASRDSANQRTFKDFAGGQLYIEHAGSPQRLKSTSVRKLIVDEIDEFAGAMRSGDDPVAMLDGRTSAFPANYQRLYISTPSLEGISRIDALYKTSDQRRYHVPCPECAHLQPLEWSGLHWNPDATVCWYGCRECGSCIDEHHKANMIAAGKWVPENPESKTRGYTINCLYYPFGLGPRWLDLVQMWRDAQNDPAKLKTFVNDRLAETWEDPAMRAVKHNVIADRAEPYKLRTAPHGVLAVTAGVDTQDNRLAVHLTGWGRGLASWTLDYIELPGDPENDDVWVALVELINRPIEHACGALIRAEATAVDAGGHRTQAVYNFVRKRLLRRCIPTFGAVPNNAPVLSKGTMVDFNWKGQSDKRGIRIHHIGTVGIKHMLYGRIGADAEKLVESRMVHLSDELPSEYFTGLVAETYNPTKNRFELRRGIRNEPLDTWCNSYAATHHPELRLHRASKADWDAREARLLASVPKPGAVDSRETPQADEPITPMRSDSRETSRRGRGGFATNW
jgi:phage terminase large subunit GpA-like protein